MSRKARINFALDSIIAVAFLLSALSGILLYVFPSGYQGGRNPNYGREILFLDGHAWSSLHTWVSFVMIAGVLVHLVLHWNWIVCMIKNMLGLGKKRATRSGLNEGDVCPVLVDAAPPYRWRDAE